MLSRAQAGDEHPREPIVAGTLEWKHERLTHHVRPGTGGDLYSGSGKVRHLLHRFALEQPCERPCTGRFVDDGRDHAIRLRAAPVRLSTDKAVSVGVVVTELVTNAYKYAYPAGTSGEIRVAVDREGSDNVLLAVEDDGIGWTGEGEIRGTGLGSRIVRAMATNLRSALSYVPGCPGTRAVLSFQA